jgi:hypothetical protein
MIYASSYTGASLVEAVKTELEVIPLPGDGAFTRWLSSLEQLAWSEVIRMKRVAHVILEGGSINLDGIAVPSDEDAVCAADVCAVYADGAQAMHGTAEESFLFSPETSVWHREGEKKIAISGVREGAEAVVVYFVRPQRRASLSAAIALPDEFIELAASRLKGEAYRAANEGVLAAKWLSDYNQRLEAFQNWCDRRRTGGGAA